VSKNDENPNRIVILSRNEHPADKDPLSTTPQDCQDEVCFSRGTRVEIDNLLSDLLCSRFYMLHHDPLLLLLTH
jgi:hypothetical protein